MEVVIVHLDITTKGLLSAAPSLVPWKCQQFVKTNNSCPKFDFLGLLAGEQPGQE